MTYPIEIEDVIALRAIVPAHNKEQYLLLGHTVKGLGGGVFYYDNTDTTSLDDNGLIIVNGSYRFKRIEFESYTPEMFGAIPASTAIAQTRAINKAYAAALATGGGVIRYEQQYYSIDGNIDGTNDDSVIGNIRGGIQIKSNTTTIFTGQIFTQVTSLLTSYSLLNCSNASSFTIQGAAAFTGDLTSHGATGGEWGHGLYLANAHDFKISGLLFTRCWGDGIYISDTSLTDTNTASSYGVIENCIFQYNRRQGLSVINGQYITFINCKFLSTGQLGTTPPSSGIDLEPDATGGRLGIHNLTFNNCIASESIGPNILVFGTFEDAVTDITFNDCVLGTTGAQGSYWSDRSAHENKRIVFNSGRIYGGIYGGVATTFNDTYIERRMTDVSASVYVIEQIATTTGSRYSKCKIRAIGDGTSLSKQLLYIPAGQLDADKTIFKDCEFTLESGRPGTNVCLVTRSPVIFDVCNFLTAGTIPSGYFGFDTTASNSRVGPIYAMLYDCYIDSTWHSGIPSFQGRVDISTIRIASKNYVANNLVPTAMADVFIFNFTGASAVVIAAPSDAFNRIITITIKNTSVGALGALNWDPIYKLSFWVQPAAGYNRSITFYYNGTSWIELSRTPADVPN